MSYTHRVSSLGAGRGLQAVPGKRTRNETAAGGVRPRKAQTEAGQEDGVGHQG